MSGKWGRFCFSSRENRNVPIFRLTGAEGGPYNGLGPVNIKMAQQKFRNPVPTVDIIIEVMDGRKGLGRSPTIISSSGKGVIHG